MSNKSLSEHIRPIRKEYLDIDEYPTIHVEAPKGNTLDFCGIVHANNPDNPNDKEMLDRVKQELGDFLSRDSEHEKIVLLEGWRGPQTTMDDLSEDDLVRTGGEVALADRMARQAGVEIASPEPDGKEEFDQLCKEFPADEVFYWYVARQAVQWGREEAVPSSSQIDEQNQRRERVQDKFHVLVGKLEDTLGHPASFLETLGSFELLAETHQRLFKSELDWNDIGHFEAQANPLDDNSVMNKIHNRSNQIRDEHIAEIIQKQIHDGKDVFCVYGDGHAYTLEPALLELSK
ncbi:MAG: hypothetical protein JWN75_377 [Candidatus Saccharibacteria bacterium]|nr:hypothetical protein [Candidatus Saccharibacteria bacterium]